MLIEDRAIAAGTQLTSDVCVVGAGPAGITIARELAGRGIRVCLLAGGGFGPDRAADALNDGVTDATHYGPTAIQDGRLREFGGTSGLWVHQTVPHDGRFRARMPTARSIDFEPRPGQPLSGWDVGHAELEPFMARARVTCGLPASPIAADGRKNPKGAGAIGPSAIDVAGTSLTETVVDYGPSDVFRFAYRDELIAASDVSLLLGATATSLAAADDGSAVRSVNAATRDGRSFTVVADAYVIATGGIENARLLLASPGGDGVPLGNGHDLVGRHLTEHLEYRLGILVPDDRKALHRLGAYDMRPVAGGVASTMLVLTEEAMREHDLLSVGLILIPRGRGVGSESEVALKRLVRLRHRLGGRGLGSAMAAVAGHPLDTVGAVVGRSDLLGPAYSEFRGGWSVDDRWLSRAHGIEVIAVAEQPVHPENRIELSSRRDRLGSRLASASWRLREDDLDPLHRASRTILTALRSALPGRFEPWLDLADPAGPTFGAFHHPMSTTRLDEDPTRGVVDRDARVHGVGNLFVAGSSVFPTGLGHTNPTLTIVALAIRLADHLATTRGQAAAPVAAAAGARSRQRAQRQRPS